jgi:hypothetical protein
MAETTKKVEQAEVVNSFKPEDFQKEYEALCTKMGMLIVPSLAWVARDDGTWSTRVNLTVGALPKQQ